MVLHEANPEVCEVLANVLTPLFEAVFSRLFAYAMEEPQKFPAVGARSVILCSLRLLGTRPKNPGLGFEEQDCSVSWQALKKSLENCCLLGD